MISRKLISLPFIVINIPTSKGKQYFFFENQFYYKLKPTDLNGITIWRCRWFFDKDIRCKILLRSNNEGEVVSISGQHDHFEKDVNIVEPLMKNVVQQKKCSFLSLKDVHFTPIVPVNDNFSIDDVAGDHLHFVKFSCGDLNFINFFA
ncbi:unnamed protein product [Brachionus calyciflorus]|uniref:FLYWCH-type domain-containing protein n=1 Tax=Brachionus calyciflorus TaxID=104777 RepID=A0A814LM43_9BILA|nr:unnamed protein product [Brachionus calyciflorus]